MILVMFTCFQIELNKAFRNGWFVVALVIGCAFGLGCAALYAIPSVFSTFVPNPDKFYHPTSQSCFNAWISVDTTSWALLFYQVLPLLCVIPYAWSFASERKDGYISHAYTRVGRGEYFFAKYVSVFLSAGAVAVLPQVLNLVMLACFFPGYVPSIQDANYYAPVFWQSIGSILFYNAPLAYVALYMLIDFLLCGAWAGLVLALSLVVRNRVILLTAPYLALLAVQFVNENIFFAIGKVRGFQLSLFENLHGSCSMYIQNGWIVVGEIITLLFVTGLFWVFWGKRDAL